MLKNGRDFRSKFDRFARDFEVKNHAKLLLSSVFLYNVKVLSVSSNEGSTSYDDCAMTGKYGDCTIVNENDDEVEADVEWICYGIMINLKRVIWLIFYGIN